MPYIEVGGPKRDLETKRKLVAKLTDLIADLPPVRVIPDARAHVAQQLADTRTHIVVVDDDPTGTQTVHGVRVYMDFRRAYGLAAVVGK